MAPMSQYVLPLLQNSTVAILDRDPIRILERLLKLSLPVTYVWLLGEHDPCRS